MTPSPRLTPLIAPDRLYTRGEILARPSAAPNTPGLYAWHFVRLPGPVTQEHCLTRDGLHLLYIGIAPREPPKTGAWLSQRGIAVRLREHMAGKAEGSTVRLTIGCLLADELGIQLRRVGNGRRMAFSSGEALISQWLEENARICWLETAEPWTLEKEAIRTIPLPLNLDQNTDHPFHATLTRLRAEAKQRARELPVLPR